MTRIPEQLKPAAAEAAQALRAYLDFLAIEGVPGLPAPTLRAEKIVAVRTAPAPASAKHAQAPAPTPLRAAPTVAATVPPASTAKKEGANVPAPRPSGREPLPWERHLRGEGATEANEPPAQTAAAQAPAQPKVEPAAVVEKTPKPAAPIVPVVAPEHAAAAPASSALKQVAPGAEGLQAVRDALGDCRRCKLWTGRTQIVFGVGNPQAEIAFVGEGPGADEDMQGEPFVGKAGQLLTQMIKAMGYERSDVYICNVVKCRPPNNRDPEPDEVDACAPFLIGQLGAVKPKVIVALGRHASLTLLKTKTPITRLRGTWGTYEGIPVMPTFHPSYLLRDATQKKFAWEDLKAVLQRLGKSVPAKR